MKTNKNLLEIGKKVLEIEAKAIQLMETRLNNKFERAVELIHHSEGRVVVSGIGKSANIAQKIVATFNSTGTPSIFMHAADAIHGDLGNIQENDVVILISKSGNTPEIKVLIPLIKNLGNSIIGFVGNTQSELCQQADIALDTSVNEEACPNNLAPTSSTTCQLAMGDALAVTLLSLKGFSPEDFAKYHPGGTLGKQLYLKAKDVIAQNEKPFVYPNDKIEKAIIEISEKRLGATAVIDNNENVIGIITDGDLRRMMRKGFENLPKSVAEIMSKQPMCIEDELHLVKARSIMEKHKITQLIVTKDNKYAGFIHLHDLVREGIV